MLPETNMIFSNFVGLSLWRLIRVPNQTRDSFLPTTYYWRQVEWNLFFAPSVAHRRDTMVSEFGFTSEQFVIARGYLLFKLKLSEYCLRNFLSRIVTHFRTLQLLSIITAVWRSTVRICDIWRAKLVVENGDREGVLFCESLFALFGSPFFVSLVCFLQAARIHHGGSFYWKKITLLLVFLKICK